MIKCGNWPISLCSWSVDSDLDVLARLRDETGIEHLHLSASAVIKNGKEYLEKIQRSGWNISSCAVSFEQEDYSTLDTIKKTGGINPDNCWETNRRLVLSAIEITADLSVKYLSFHAGFIDIKNCGTLKARMAELADYAAEKNVTILMETGQESAEDLKTFLGIANHPNIKVNFDPANMILYAKGEPVEALKTLKDWIRYIHIKDATKTNTLGTWGTEVPWGTGDVDADKFLSSLKEIQYNGSLAIEREVGENRFEDIISTIRYLQNFNT
jgi:L-ribulose-5-phosphate 3-epimerase